MGHQALFFFFPPFFPFFFILFFFLSLVKLYFLFFYFVIYSCVVFRGIWGFFLFFFWRYNDGYSLCITYGRSVGYPLLLGGRSWRSCVLSFFLLIFCFLFSAFLCVWEMRVTFNPMRRKALLFLHLSPMNEICESGWHWRAAIYTTTTSSPPPSMHAACNRACVLEPVSWSLWAGNLYFHATPINQWLAIKWSLAYAMRELSGMWPCGLCII